MREVRPVSAIYADKVSSCPTLYEGSPRCQRFRHNMTGIAWGKFRGFSWWASGAIFIWFPALKPDSDKFSGKNNGSGHCVRTVQCLSTIIIISNTTLAMLTVLVAPTAEHKEDSKTQNLNDFRLWASFLELSRNHRCALSRKLWGDEKSDVYQ